ncbi:tetratricopeptide repeat protein [Sphingomonas sp. HF-S3]|uniref:Tetratricopeptide repeat protein n=1 Tax=Sphingomonas rustica TaxID=3103142 RepID=A0ABV0B8J4_9SPHN
MKMVSKLAIAMALSLGVSATPALAQKKDDKAPAIKVSEEFRKPAEAARVAIGAKDWATADTQLTAAEAVAKNDDEKNYAQILRFEVEVNRNPRNNQRLIAAADAMLANPAAPQANLRAYNFYRGQASFELKQYAQAEPFLVKAREQGMNSPDLSLMLAQIYDSTNRRPQGVAEMAKVIEAVKASGQPVQESWYRWAVGRVAATGDRSALADWQLRQIRDFPTLANWRQIIIQYRNSAGTGGAQLDRNAKLDIYRLLRGTGAMADLNDYLDYASLAQSAGLPQEALAVLDEGRKAGKIPGGEPTAAQIERLSKDSAAKDGSPDALAKAAKSGKEQASVGDLFAATGNYPRAIELYQTALSGGAPADQTNLHLGVALAKAGRKDEAKAALAKVQAAPLNDIAKYWTLWLDLPPLQ